MGSLSPIHWLIVIVVILLVFGPSRLAGVGKGLGEGIRSFKKGINEDPGDDEKDDKAADAAKEPKLVEKKPSGEVKPGEESKSSA
jgi:sec-independent protein translocase protein TatA